MKDFNYAVVIGRFQPVHKAHISLIEKALEIADNVIIVLGSNRSAPTVKNPWSPSEREKMILSCFTQDQIFGQKFNGGRRIIDFTTVKDYHYNNTFWMTEVHNRVKSITGDCPNDKIVLVGNNKDRSTFYLDLFPQWAKREFKFNDKNMNATEIRNEYFEYTTLMDIDYFNEVLHPNVVSFLKTWKEKDIFLSLALEFAYYQDYKESFASTPFPVTFVTTDAVVIKSGHVLLIRRKVNPGKGLLALPGGFLNPEEWIEDCALRELKEETRIKVDKKTLREHITDQRVFDHPDRSLRGRSITHAYFIKLPDGGELPQVKGDDDAEHAMWIPIGDLPLHEHEFFEDHLPMIGHFVNKW